MEYSDVRHAVKSTFYTNTSGTIKLLVILEYLVSKNLWTKACHGASGVKRFNPQFLGIAKGQITMGHEDVIRRLKISHYLEAVL